MPRSILKITIAVVFTYLGLRIFTSNVTTTHDVIPSPEIENMATSMTQSLFTTTRYTAPVGPNVTPSAVMTSMFSSWAIAPEKIILKLVVAEYMPLSDEDDTKIFGMFDVKENDQHYCILHWKLATLEGLHVFSVAESTAIFETVFWSKKPLSKPFLLFHDLYSQILLAAAVKKLAH